MSIAPAAACFLAIEPGLQLFDRGAGQDQRLVAHDVVNVGAHGRHQVDALQVGRGMSERNVQRVAVDYQGGLAEAKLAKLRVQGLGLAFLDVEIVDDDQLAVLRLRRQGHFQAKRTDLLVEARGEDAGTRAVRLTAADEDRGAAIAVASRTAALLATELLAGAGNIAALTRSAGRTTA